MLFYGLSVGFFSNGSSTVKNSVSFKFSTTVYCVIKQPLSIDGSLSTKDAHYFNSRRFVSRSGRERSVKEARRDQKNFGSLLLCQL